MNFLHPALLLALPLMALPIIIHLINQRRYQTVQWGAMMFLLAANRMSRGYARLRQWLIMAFRMAAIAALIFALSRPLAGGWLGLSAGGRTDTTIILLDRSPSMEQQGQGREGGESKLQTARRQLAQTLGVLGSNRWVLIESGTNQAKALESAQDLNGPNGPNGLSSASDLPAMLEAARKLVQAERAGRTEVWIVSDLRRNDWKPDDVRWRTIREAFLGFPQGVRFHLLAYPRQASSNLAIRVSNVRRQTGDSNDLLVSLRIDREGGDPSARQTVPVQFEIGGARSELSVELTGPRFELKEHRIPLAADQKRGWGKVSIPADSNEADNTYYFAFDQPAPRKAIVVAEDSQVAQALSLVASVSPDPALTCSAEVVSPDLLNSVEWNSASLVLWQGPLPQDEAAEHVRTALARGCRVLFFPPASPGTEEFAGVRWGAWTERQDGVAVETWRGDQDLLANTQNGSALPVGELQVRRWCGLSGEFTHLATLNGGDPLLARVATNGGGAYFCTTTPTYSDSSLATQGVAFYVLIQRAQAAGAEALETTRQWNAGPLASTSTSSDNDQPWTRLAGGDEAISTDYSFHAGVYSSGDRLLAVNRPPEEDGAPVLDSDQVAGLFQGLDYSRVDDQEGNVASLIQEIWRVFLLAMMVSLLVEAALCMPRPVPRTAEGHS